MSEQTQVNDNVVLIGGESATGKSASLRNIDNERVLYVNCEAGKKLPFKAKCQQVVLTDPRDIFDLIEEVNESDDIDVVWEALLLSLHKFEPNLRETAEEVCDKIVENKI